MVGFRAASGSPPRPEAADSASEARSPSARYWMRGVSFATLHRALCTFARSQAPVRSRDLSAFVTADLERVRGDTPGATTIYRYRSTLCRLGLMSNQARLWRVEMADPLVRSLVELSPGDGASLVWPARVPFADLVVRHPDCRALLFDLLAPDACGTLDFDTFLTRGDPVTWRHVRRGDHHRLDVWNRRTGQSRCFEEKQAVLSLLYGLRYWVRDELGVVDEYAELGENAATMFAVDPVAPEDGPDWEARVLDAVRFVLGARRGPTWTTMELADLIRRYCIERRQPRRVLFAGLDWLCRRRAESVALVPTPVAVATLSASSASRDHLELGRYYRDVRGRFIGDVRIHADAEVPLALD